MLATNSIGLLNDFTKALGQQLYFWGCDARHPRGNLLCEFGLERRKEEGVTGSSCYSMSYNDDIIELHGLCVGRYSKTNPSFLYTRQHKSCWVYEDSRPPVPGCYNRELINTKSIERVEQASRAFLEWWLEYEAWVTTHTDAGYRQHCHQLFRRKSKASSWLKPADAQAWLQQYMDSPETLQRAKRWKQQRRSSVSSSEHRLQRYPV